MMRRLLPLLLLLISCLPAQAQFLGIGRRAKPNELPPKALLVELHTRPNQRDYLVKNRPELLSEFDHDVSEVARLTIVDWTHYFRFCPVYFFEDTVAERVRRGEFAGVLLDSNKQRVMSPIIPEGERNIYIAYFGTPIPQPDTVRPTTPGQSAGQYMEHDGDDATSIIHDRLLVNDADFRMLSERKPRTNFVRAWRPYWMSNDQYRSYNRSLTYNARRWYIDYHPIAYSYDATLRRYFRLIKKTKTDTE